MITFMTDYQKVDTYIDNSVDNMFFSLSLSKYSTVGKKASKHAQCDAP